jgi:hypothetical protein
MQILASLRLDDKGPRRRAAQASRLGILGAGSRSLTVDAQSATSAAVTNVDGFEAGPGLRLLCRELARVA